MRWWMNPGCSMADPAHVAGCGQIADLAGKHASHPAQRVRAIRNVSRRTDASSHAPMLSDEGRKPVCALQSRHRGIVSK